ncbi:Mutanase [Colletotrichum gloeosporioides]|uniref:Mutanase n=1 Tax=Colletotrichum gloeosporioides TaxID=474922 RepID=A0A8H4FNU6_COLGL|nr:Mutanase [Colletotrichum gloeosporioides]KAF3807739.1 Mutanase [Colletotrichum gloeosporioides]
MEALLIFAFILFFSGMARGRAVFAHFMVSNTEFYTASDFEYEISLAQEAHIDAFVLNIAYGEKTNDVSLPPMFDAASRRGFKLLFSFDYAGQGPWPQDAVIDLLEEYASRPVYFLHGSQPLVSTFEGPSSYADWPEIKKRTNCFFIPSWSSWGARRALRPGVADGLFSWAAWPEGPNPMDTSIDASYIEFLDGKTYMMPVSPWFYTNLPGYSKNWLWRGDDLWYDRWNQVWTIRPEYVQIISWNDFGESHYIGPLNDKAYVAFGPEKGKAPFNYAVNRPHDGWRRFLPYLIDTYKSGKATVSEESLVSWYRLSPSRACASGGTKGNTGSQLQAEVPPETLAQDRVSFSAMLTSPADIELQIGGETTSNFEWISTPPGGVGIYHGSVPFWGRTGTVSIRLLRNGQAFTRLDGPAILSTCPHGLTNWNPWVGTAIASTSIQPKAPPLSLEEQVCVKGFGDEAHNRLCLFTCMYHYCPLGPCTCQLLGEPLPEDKMPEPTHGPGYPNPGLDCTFLGLCSFGCNNGACPESTCSRDESLKDKCVIPPEEPLPDDSGHGYLWIGEEIWDMPQPRISCVPPCTLVLPPWPSMTSTIDFPRIMVTRDTWVSTITRPPITVTKWALSTVVVTTPVPASTTTDGIILIFPPILSSTKTWPPITVSNS